MVYFFLSLSDYDKYEHNRQNKTMYKTYFSALLGLILFTYSCTTEKTKRNIDRETLLKEAPVLSPEEFMDFTYLEEGFELQLVASEPEVVAPIALQFDHKNRIWAVEMTGYMPNVDGEGEDSKSGKIVILEDKDNDGHYETRKVFLDSLALPRSIALVEDGILVVEPPNLWYFDIVNDKAQNKTLVDPQYTQGNNVEAQANGLFRSIDNWIYNGGSNKRYKKTKEGWLIEKTHLRGQWGVTQDDDGRLFYNNNSQNLLGDYFLPSLGSNNKNLRKVSGFNERIVDDNRTYPSRPTPGVNRGYVSSVLDDSLRLKSFTAACGPVIYRADLFGEEYYQNAFVAEPAAHLIKRNVLNFNDKNKIDGAQAYAEKEFLASDDERFRPVSLYNGPDGGLYIADMYRGIIQHKLFLTKYLKDEITKRDLEEPLGYGRIYKVVPKGNKSQTKPISDSPQDWVQLLKNENSWMRETAQQLLVDNKPGSVIKELKQQFNQPVNKHEYIHTLWTLVGMEALSSEEIVNYIVEEESDANLIQLYTALEKTDDSKPTDDFFNKTMSLAENQDLAPYIAFKMDVFEEFNSTFATKLKVQLINDFPESLPIAHALISNAAEKEDELYNSLKSAGVSQKAIIFKEIEKVQETLHKAGKPDKKQELNRKYGRGINLYKSTCQPCHGEDGNGIDFTAPPLNNSEWVTGDKEKLISIVLYGLSGPVTVDGKVYDVPETTGEMPGVINNPEMVEADLALLLSYIRNNWNNEADDITLEDIHKAKKKWKDRKDPFTEEELNDY